MTLYLVIMTIRHVTLFLVILTLYYIYLIINIHQDDSNRHFLVVFQWRIAEYFIQQEDGKEEEEVDDGEDTACVLHLQ